MTCVGEIRVPLGSTDVLISPLGIGTWAWGDKLVWGYGKGYSDKDLEEAFLTSVERCVTFFDTAEVYGWGKSERLLGSFVRRHNADVTVATKFFPYPWRLRKRALLKALKGSLRRLGLDRVDLYQVHWPFPPRSIEVWVDALADAVDAGLARAVGVSNYDSDQMRRAHLVLTQRGIPLASNQVHFSLLHREPESSGLLHLCHEMDITLIAYSPLEMGILSGKYTPDNPPRGTRGRRYNREFLKRVQPLIHLMREIGTGHGDKTPAQVALNWVICKGAVPIVGAKNRRQAEENAGALGWRLDPEDIIALDKAAREVLKD